jgi:hypothetical protein
MQAKKVMLTVAAVGMLAWGLRAAAVTAVSGPVSVDARCQAEALAPTDQACDTRGYTVDWSGERPVDTRIPQGTLFFLK